MHTKTDKGSPETLCNAASEKPSQACRYDAYVGAILLIGGTALAGEPTFLNRDFLVLRRRLMSAWCRTRDDKLRSSDANLRQS